MAARTRAKGVTQGPRSPRADPARYFALYPEKSVSDADFTWGSRWEVRPAMKWWGLGPGNETYA